MQKNRLKSIRLAILATIVLLAQVVIPPMPAYADYPVVVKTATITGTSANVTILPLTGQSSCNVEIVGTASGTTQGLVQGTWVNINSVKLPDSSGATPSPTLTGAGTYTANCASMQGFQFVPTSVTGSATITVLASGGIGRVIGSSVNGGISTINGSAPITVTTTGGTSTVGLTTPLGINYGGTGQTSFASGCLQSNGTTISSSPCPVSTPVSVTSGLNTAVSTPSPGVFSVSTVTNPVFASLTDSGLNAGNCVYVGTSGLLQDGSQVSGTNYLNATNSYGAGNSYSIAATSIPSAIPAFSTIKIINNTLGTSSYAFAGAAYSAGYTGGISTLIFGATGSGALSFYSSTNTVSLSAFSTGDAGHSASTTPFGSYTYTLPAASTVALPVNTWIKFDSAGVGFYGTLNSALSIGDTSITYTAQQTYGSPAASINNVNLSSVAPTPFSTSSSCVSSIVAGSNITVTQPSPGVYSIAASTPSPAPTYTAGTGISIVSNTINNTGVLSVTGSGNISVTAGATPNVTITSAPTFANVTDSALTSGNCVQASTAGLLTTVSAACGIGTLTGLTAGSNIVVGTGPSPSVGTTNAPTFSGQVTAGQVFANGATNSRGIGTQGGTSGSDFGFYVSGTAGVDHPNSLFVYNSNALHNTIQGPDSTATINTITGTCWSMYDSTASGTSVSTRLETHDCSGNVGIAGQVRAGSFYGSGTGLTSGTVPNAALVTAPVTGLTAGSNIAVGSGTTPTVAVTAAPTFSTITDSALTSGQCVSAGAAGLLTGYTCPTKAIIFLPMGFYGGTVNATIPYPYYQTPAYSSGKITTLRVACATADNGTTVFTVKDVTAAVTIGTLSMANAATTTTNTLGTPYSLITGNVLNTVVTTAGTATSCGVTAEGTQLLQ